MSKKRAGNVCRSERGYIKNRQKGVCVPLSSFGVYTAIYSGCYPGDCAAVQQQQHVPRRSLL